MRSIMIILLFALAASGAAGAVYNVHLHTDSTPDYVDVQSFLDTAHSTWTDPEDQAIALWRWMTRTHLQTHTTREDGRGLWDPIQFYASYPNSFCGYMAGFLTSFADAKGGAWRHRYLELGDHTVAELSWDGGQTWHMFDTSMVAFARNHAGEIADHTDLGATQSCALSDWWGAPGAEEGHVYLYHTDASIMSNPPDPAHSGELTHSSGYRKASDNPVLFERTLRNGADSYTSSNDVQTGYTHVRRGWVNRLHLKPGHEYARYWAPQGSGPDYARMTTHDTDPNEGAYEANIRGNGYWSVRPDFSAADPAPWFHDLQGVVHRDADGGAGPALRPAAGAASAAITLKLAAANVLTSGTVHLAGTRGAGDAVVLELSRDGGCTWQTVASPAAGAFDAWHVLTPALIGGAHEILVRATLTPDATRTDVGLDDLQITAFTQLNRMTLPRFQRGPNTVRFAAGPAHETITLKPSLHAGAALSYTQSTDSWSGVTARDEVDNFYKATLVPTTAGQDGQVTWRIDTPTDITGFEFGGSFIAKSTLDRVALEASWNGSDFTELEVFDSGTASTWDARLFAVSASVPAGARSVWLRYRMRSGVDGGWQSGGIQDALLKVHHQAQDAAFAPVAVTWNWIEHRTEGDVPRSHTRIVNNAEERWNVNVGGFRDPTMVSVITRLADGTEIEGYGDGQDVGPGAGYDKQVIGFDWMDDLSHGRPYTVSRPASATNPDTDGAELTDGTLIAPTRWTGATLVQNQTALWDGDAPLAVTVDLGAVRTFRAVRVTTHQPSTDYAHAGTITVSGDGSTLGTIQHDQVWSPPGDHMDWSYERSTEFADLPAGGRLAHSFWLLLDAPATARNVRLDFLPLSGRGLSVSEIQVFSDVTVTDWPDREIDLGDIPTATEDPGDAAPEVSFFRLDVHPNPMRASTVISYALPTPARMQVRVVDLRGRVVRVLEDAWKSSGTHRATWDGRGDDGRDLPSGRYLAVVEADGIKAVGALSLVR
ncbi:hypothetical protein KDK88_01150 [bacterium]|nr:hypothetical protein [bacterium]